MSAGEFWPWTPYTPTTTSCGMACQVCGAQGLSAVVYSNGVSMCQSCWARQNAPSCCACHCRCCPCHQPWAAPAPLPWAAPWPWNGIVYGTTTGTYSVDSHVTDDPLTKPLDLTFAFPHTVHFNNPSWTPTETG